MFVTARKDTKRIVNVLANLKVLLVGFVREARSERKAHAALEVANETVDERCRNSDAQPREQFVDELSHVLLHDRLHDAAFKLRHVDRHECATDENAGVHLNETIVVACVSLEHPHHQQQRFLTQRARNHDSEQLPQLPQKLLVHTESLSLL